ncbi:MAG TPA: hypothetical protein VIC35_03805 [Acidimicrobiia bacterium]|jgi:hypothetical protein
MTGGGSAPFSVGDAISYGWRAYWKFVGPLLLVTLVAWGVSIVFSVIGSLTNNAIASLLLSLIGWIVGLIIAMGLIRCALAVVEGRTPEVSMLFQTEGLGSYIIASIVAGLIIFVGLILCIVPGIIAGIILMFYGFAIVERPDTKPMEALARSRDLTQGRLGELFLFGLALLGINIIGALLCLVGLLFTYGITAVAVAYAYRSLSNQSIAPA